MNITPKMFFYLLLAVFLSAVAAAQSTGSINGTLLDPTQAGVAGGQLTLTNVDTGQVRPATSSREGYFNFADLAPGRYVLTISVSGFKELILQSLVLTVGQQMTVHPALQIGDVKQTVEVSAAPPPVATSTSSISQLVDQQRLEQLPLNGRNALQLVSLVPGAVSAGTAGQWGVVQSVFSVSGGRDLEMNFTLDGGVHMNPFYGIANEYPNPDTLQEFAVNIRTYNAALGRGSASVTAVTKSGTNQFHGTLFEFLRNEDLDSRPFFSAARPIFKRNQYGGTLGGPIIRNKLFFLVGYQGTKQRGTPGDTSYTSVPLQERTGNFSDIATLLKDPTTGLPFPGNQIPASRVQPYALNFFNSDLPAPNAGKTYRFRVPTKLDQNQLTTRVDYSASANDKIWFRYFLDDIPQTSLIGPTDASWVADYPARIQNFNLGYTRVFSPNIVNELRATYVRSAFGLLSAKDFSLSGLGMPIVPANEDYSHGLTGQSVLGIVGYFTATNSAPTRDIMPVTHFSDTLSWNRGRHQLNLGAEAYINRINEIENYLTGGQIQFDGSVTGNAVADFEIGRFSTFRQITNFSSRLHQKQPSLFAQDDIRVSRRLTLNLGLRWEPEFGYTSENDQMATYLPGKQSTVFPKALPGLLYPGDYGLPRDLMGTRWNNLAPRVGLAWDVMGNGKTSVRAGFGVYYVADSRGNTQNLIAATLQPFTTSVTVAGGDVNNIFAPAPFNGKSPFPRPNRSDLTALQQAVFLPTADEGIIALPYKTPTSRQWSFSIQQAVGSRSVFEATYAGSSMVHGITQFQANPAIYVPGQSTIANEQQRRLDPAIGSNIALGNEPGSSSYNGLQLSFNRHYAKGFSILASYTWSKVLGLPDENSISARDPFNYLLDYGPLSYDRRHNSVNSVIWDVPMGKNMSWRVGRALLAGWQISGIVSMSSGPPLTLRSGRDNSLVGASQGTAATPFDTPDQVGDWRLPGGRAKAQEISQWFKPSAFTQNAIGTFGTAGIGALRSPGSWNVDSAVARSFRIRESKRIELRGSFYNMLNHANLGAPNATQSSATFGQITSASTPRVIEGSLKFAF